MRNINLPLNQHKTITVRKIMKLRKIKKIKKIKKRKIKVPKAPIVNSDHGIKMEEDKIKNNESNSGNNSIQQIIQRPNSLREDFDIFRNESDAFLKIPNYNIFILIAYLQISYLMIVFLLKMKFAHLPHYLDLFKYQKIMLLIS